jgi:hypothetical protein
MQPCAQLFMIAARAQTTACQLFRASHSGLQTPARNSRFFCGLALEDRSFAIRLTRYTESWIDTLRSEYIPQRPQSSHYHHLLSQHSLQRSKRPIVSVNAASPPHASSCDKQRISSHHHHVRSGKELFACLRRPLSVFLSSSFASTENRIPNTTTKPRRLTPRPIA